MQCEIWMSVIDSQGLKNLIDKGYQAALNQEILLELINMPVRVRIQLFEDFNFSHFGKSDNACLITDEFQSLPNALREWYSDIVYLPFENMMVPAPAQQDTLLKCRYGDYMKPIHEPNMHDGIFLDPDIPYTKYKK